MPWLLCCGASPRRGRWRNRGQAAALPAMPAIRWRPAHARVGRLKEKQTRSAPEVKDIIGLCLEILR